jgi:transposase InsO family protein
MIGTLKRDGMHHFLFLSEGHLLRTIRAFRQYYNRERPHQGIMGIPSE